jgi:hypothetical protein
VRPSRLASDREFHPLIATSGKSMLFAYIRVSSAVDWRMHRKLSVNASETTFLSKVSFFCSSLKRLRNDDRLSNICFENVASASLWAYEHSRTYSG